ncbi:uncharacterized protein HD556DRAFT_400108 [Suillus plorans]|uniref:C2H2-type domain-containing protein n=1 Tax=Suillus plorans TaxID=116603 RepID=A0A9P7ATK9_9AGAM|nr:uncharacterized protein HD556DRAFT_400108 [Suillus plorans]KAG1795199.1 hypothetical protein HD556DRAFT_400108 [Suillus plorans]
MTTAIPLVSTSEGTVTSVAHSLSRGSPRQKGPVTEIAPGVGSGLAEDPSVFDILNVFRRRLFVAKSDIVGHTMVATKSEDGRVAWLTFRPGFHSMMVKTAFAVFFGDSYHPHLVDKTKKVLFVYLLEVVNSEGDNAFFSLEKGATAYNRANHEKKRLARKRARAAKRERTRILAKGGHVAVAVQHNPSVDPLACPKCKVEFRSRKQLKKHTCKKSAGVPPPSATQNSSQEPPVTAPSGDVKDERFQADLAEALAASLTQADQAVPSGNDVSQLEAPQSHTAPHFARWARDSGVPRVCEDCPEPAVSVVLHGNYETACYLKCFLHDRGRGERWGSELNWPRRSYFIRYCNAC